MDIYSKHMQQRLIVGAVALGALLMAGERYITHKNPHVIKPPITATSTTGEGNPGDGNGGGNPGGPVAKLSVSGSQILDKDGKPIILRGFNWGRWDTAQPQDGIENVAQGANVVRVPLRWWGEYDGPEVDSRKDDAPGHINPVNLAVLDKNVKWASDQHLYIDIFIDSNCGQNGMQDNGKAAKYCDPENKYGKNGHNFWTDREMRAKYIEVWKFIANRYKNTPYVGIYEIQPEPNPTGKSAAEISEFYKEMIAAIRSVDPITPVLIGAGGGYSIKRAHEAYLPDIQGVIYTGNLFVYTGQSKDANIAGLSERLKYLTDMRTKYNVPIFVQQTGVRSQDDPDYAYQNAVLSLLNKNKVGWTWWTYRQDGGFNDGYGIWYTVADSRTGTHWEEKTEVLRLMSKYFNESHTQQPD